MSLSPFDSFQSRFVTYLLNRPRNYLSIASSYIYFNLFPHSKGHMTHPPQQTTLMSSIQWHPANTFFQNTRQCVKTARVWQVCNPQHCAIYLSRTSEATTKIYTSRSSNLKQLQVLQMYGRERGLGLNPAW